MLNKVSKKKNKACKTNLIMQLIFLIYSAVINRSNESVQIVEPLHLQKITQENQIKSKWCLVQSSALVKEK